MSEDVRVDARAHAQRAIYNALRRYCAAIDGYDRTTFLELWTKDAQLDFGARYKGDPEGFFVSVINLRKQTPAMIHRLEDVTITLSDDLTSAQSSSEVVADVTRVTQDGELHRQVRGRYEDRWTFVDGCWLIQHRQYRPITETTLNEA